MWWGRVGSCTYCNYGWVGGGHIKISTALTSGCGIACCPCTAYAWNKWKQSFHRPHIWFCWAAHFSSNNTLGKQISLKHIKASFAAWKANRTFHRLASPNPIWELVTESAVGKSQFSGPSAKCNPPFSVHTDCSCSQLNVKQIMNIHFQISI